MKWVYLIIKFDKMRLEMKQRKKKRMTLASHKVVSLSQQRMRQKILDLSLDCWGEIFSFYDPIQYSLFPLVCKEFYHIYYTPFMFRHVVFNTKQRQRFMKKRLITRTKGEGQDLNELKNLTHLSILHEKILPKPKYETKKLKELVLSLNFLDNLSFVSQFENLEKLFVSFNQIRSLDGLSCLKNLKSLSINFSLIEDISVLSHLPQLEYINLAHNKIVHLSPLSQCEYLKKLILNHNLVEDLSPLASLKYLRALNVNYNCIKKPFVLFKMTIYPNHVSEYGDVQILYN